MTPQTVPIWSAYEAAVAEFYRRLGATKVQQNADLAGNQVDVYVEERTPSGQTVKVAVECKFFRQPVPKDAVLQFAYVARFLKNAGLVDKAVMVAYGGFTSAASAAAQAADVELQTFSDFEARIEYRYHGAVAEVIENAERIRMPEEFPDLVFVLMPFVEELEDLYLFGIRQSAERHGLRCKRADEIHHDNAVVTEIVDHIKRARVVVAEVSDHNPNVFYEVGWAHALGRPTILVARRGSNLPFDIAHINTILYGNIKDLSEQLSLRFAELRAGRAER